MNGIVKNTCDILSVMSMCPIASMVMQAMVTLSVVVVKYMDNISKAMAPVWQNRVAISSFGIGISCIRVSSNGCFVVFVRSFSTPESDPVNSSSLNTMNKVPRVTTPARRISAKLAFQVIINELANGIQLSFRSENPLTKVAIVGDEMRTSVNSLCGSLMTPRMIWKKNM